MATTTDQQLEQLKKKYESVFNMIQQQRIRLTHVNMEGNKLFIQGDAPSEDAKNRVWDQIKLINANWQNELIADIRTSGPKPSGTSGNKPSSDGGQRTYTVRPGDTLSKIAKEMYGNPNDYEKIFEANRDQIRNPNEIRAGQELKIPN